MDRTQFLSSIPYLVPTSLLGWPPRRGGSVSRDNEEVSYRHEILVSRDSYAISLEPHSSVTRNSSNNAKGIESQGPIFFPPSADDASMCPVAICLEYTSISTVPPAGLFPTVATPTSRRTFTTAAASSSPPNRLRECCTAIFIRIQGKSYMLDWTHLKHLAMEVGGHDNEKGNDDGNRRARKKQTDTLQKNLAGFYMDDEGQSTSTKGHVKKPPSLVFVFESLIMRIFPFSSSLSSTYDQDRQTDLIELEKVERSLADALFQMRQEASFGSHWNHLLAANSSPAASSTTTGTHSSSQQRQQHPFLAEPADREGAKQKSNDSSHRLERKCASLLKCQSTVEALQTFLDAPLSSMPSLQTTAPNTEQEVDNEKSRKNRIEQIIASLMGQSAETLASSYVDPNQLEKEYAQEQLHQEAALQTSLEPLLEEFFPSRRKRQRTTSPQKAPGNPPPDTTKTLEQVQSLLDNHYAQVETRHQWLLLPTRRASR